MRYAIFVEKPEITIPPMHGIYPDAPPPAILLKKRGRKSAKLSSSILMGCAKTVCLFLRLPVWWNIWKFPHECEFNPNTTPLILRFPETQGDGMKNAIEQIVEVWTGHQNMTYKR